MPAQVERIAALFYSDVVELLCVLEMDPDAIRAAGTDVRFENGGNGELFPHIYGPLDPTWVLEAKPARMADGRLVVG